MTWIVGTPALFGYGVGISDVRVTLGDGSEHDCLQKIYPVGNFIAMGFAGSVRIGFAMVDELSDLLSAAKADQMWDPNAVAKWWPEDARNIFEQFPLEEQAGQSHLMMVSAFPDLDSKTAPWGRAYIHIFKSPDFQGVSIPVHKLGAIGCGTDVKPCQDAVDELNNNQERFRMLWQGEMNCPGGMANMLGINLTTVLQRTQPRGISAHLHYCWVYCKKVIIKTNDHWAKGRWSTFGMGSGINRPEEEKGADQKQRVTEPHPDSFTMPEIATSWDQLERLLDAAGASAHGCVA
jgi:hypothetical protein